MEIKKKKWLLLLKKPTDTRISQDIIVEETDEDKILVSCEVIDWDEDFKPWDFVIVWKYALFLLEYKGEQVYFADKDDILGSITKNV